MSNVLKTAQLHKSFSANTTLVSKNVSTLTFLFLVLVLRIYFRFVTLNFQLEILHHFTHFDPLFASLSMKFFHFRKRVGMEGRKGKNWKKNSQEKMSCYNLHNYNSPSFVVVAE